MGSRVYFVQDDDERVKIGYSSNPNSRIISLRSANGGRLHLIRLIDGGAPTERWLHKRFTAQRLGGEWFAFHRDMLSVMPPDELPVRRKVKPRLRLTLREALLEAERCGLPLSQRQLALILVEAMWDDDVTDLLAWIRARVAPSSDRTSA